MILEEGLIAIGILALVAAMFVLRGKGKASQSKQQVVYEPAANKQVVDLARPSVSPMTQGMGSVSAGNEQVAGFAESAVSARTEVTFSVPTADTQAGAFGEPSQMTETSTQVAFPVQSTTVVAQTPVWKIQPTQTQVELTQPSQAQVAVVLDGQLTAKPDQGLPEVQTQSGIPSGVMPLPPLKPGSRLFPHSLSIDQQMAELIAETWALQQQVAEIGCRLNYLNTCIQRSLVSASDEPGNTSRGEN